VGSDIALLAGLDEDEQRRIVAASRLRRFDRREIIFHEGDPGESVHLVLDGHVGIRMSTPRGDIGIVRIIGSGGFFGELALLSEGPRSATAVALTPTRTRSVTREQFGELRRTSPGADAVLLDALASEVRRLAAAHLEALYLPAEKRLYRRLLEAARQFGGQPPVTIPLTQDEVSQLAGTSRPTANQLMVEARDAGALELGRGRIVVLDPDWLARRGS
jgi:CRP/FNR family transcriptional regulator, cyclic AMP receptor protein